MQIVQVRGWQNISGFESIPWSCKTLPAGPDIALVPDIPIAALAEWEKKFSNQCNQLVSENWNPIRAWLNPAKPECVSFFLLLLQSSPRSCYMGHHRRTISQVLLGFGAFWKGHFSQMILHKYIYMLHSEILASLYFIKNFNLVPCIREHPYIEMLFWQYSNKTIYFGVVGKIPDQHFNASLSSNLGHKVLIFFF